MSPFRQLFSPLADSFLQVWSAQSTNGSYGRKPSEIDYKRISNTNSNKSAMANGAIRGTQPSSEYEKLFKQYNQENGKS